MNPRNGQTGTPMGVSRTAVARTRSGCAALAAGPDESPPRVAAGAIVATGAVAAAGAIMATGAVAATGAMVATGAMLAADAMVATGAGVFAVPPAGIVTLSAITGTMRLAGCATGAGWPADSRAFLQP